jgi:hypothetical protein
LLLGALLTALIGGTQAFAQAPPVISAPATVAAPSALAIDIHDIRGPEPIASPWLWAMWLVGGALVATGGYAAWCWNQRRKVAAAKLPYEIALERLEAARALMRPEAVREFSIAVSDIVRLYVEERFHVMAAHRTTEEFLYDLLNPSDALLAAHRVSLADFLHHCDLAKFGAWTLSAQNMETMQQSARRFVFITGKPGLTPATHDVAQSSANKDMYDSAPAT